ncbi:dodecin family protein [Ostreibacterium oceani]|uniref:Dodecin domain-containing protein n=1 Tax=Ostreibacterium oceani TaxID=2654998 RepID=A0A6N7EW53_9GAMM|nr:dodecin family protein [Ostreibacterium oceani]MPV86781.1 dodecin domain-containing protein [Ostreibacterium oceani]
MSIAKVTEIIASSETSFEHAIENAVERANKTIDGMTSAWVKDQSVTIKDGKIDEYRVNLCITFVLKD